jgi:hypothetical protein
VSSSAYGNTSCGRMYLAGPVPDQDDGLSGRRCGWKVRCGQEDGLVGEVAVSDE